MPITENTARQNLKALLADFDKLTPEDRKTMSEASVVRQFVDRLLEEVLGWPIKDPARYKYEMHTQAGRPDLTLFPESGGVIFVEAKKFGVIKELEQARFTAQGVITPGQMALPGMSIDRTPEEQQAINYAFANGGTWAILTNFERLRLFNARRDWLVLSFERTGAYTSEFDQLWQLAYHNVLNGSLDTLSNQRYARDIDNAYLDFINEWRLKLAQDIIKGRDKNAWVFRPDGGIDLLALRSVVQRYLDRLVVARFAEDWLVIPPGTLREFANMRQGNRYTFPMDQYLDQFFRRFDEEHNSALFAPGLVDEATFSDDALLPLIDKLYEVRYRAMPADILGNTYEQYLGKALVLTNGTVETRDNLETRKKQGSYYTPQVIVQYIVDNSLGRYLYGTADGKPDGEALPGETRKTSRDILDLRCLDSACGSGSFLIYAYRVLADFYERETARLRAELDARIQKLAADFTEITTDDRIANQRLENEMARISDYPRLILETHLYGVDLDPQAAEIATVNLIMRAMEGRHKEKLLPLILNQNVKVGNGLVGKVPHPTHPHPQPLPAAQGGEQENADNSDGEGEEYRAAVAELRKLRADLIQSSGADQHAADIAALDSKTRALADTLDAELNTLTPSPSPTLRGSSTAGRGEQEARTYFSDLGRVRPFHWGIEFPEVFYNDDGTPKANGGFTIIFGNPPWEVVQPDLREFYNQFDEKIESKYTRAQVDARIAELDAEDPRRRETYETQNVATTEVANYFAQTSDYRNQGRGKSATHKLFIERMWSLLQSNGRLGYVIPSGIYTDLGTKELREMLVNGGNIQYIYSFSNERFFFPGVDHRVKFAILGAQKGEQRDGFWAAFRFDPRVAVAPDDLPGFLANRENLIYVRWDSIKTFSPNSLSIMEFQTRRDYEIAEKIYGEWPLLGDDVADLWKPAFAQEINMTSDREIFSTSGEGFPLYEGKMVHQFNAFMSKPSYWVDPIKGRQSILGKSAGNTEKAAYEQNRFVLRAIARNTDERTLIATIIPANCFVGNSLLAERNPTDPRVSLYLVSIMNSYCLDSILRSKIATNINMFFLYQLPVPRLTAGNLYFDAIVPRAARLTCTRAEFAGLWEAVMGEQWETPPPSPLPVYREGEQKPVIDPAGRQQVRDEIDALVAHLYGLSRDEYDHILGTFPLVFPDDDAGRSRRAAALAAYDNVKV